MIKNIVGITLDEPKFKKMSKKIKDKLSNDYGLDLKTSEIHEMISISLGFRNYHGLQDSLIIEKSTFPKASLIENGDDSNIYISIPESQKRLDNIFNNSSMNSLVSLFTLFLDDKDGMWKSRAISLISVVLTVLVFQRENQNVCLDRQKIRESLHLDFIIKISQEKTIPPDIQRKIKNYLISLPGFKEGEDKQAQHVLEQHSYLEFQFIPMWEWLREVEQDDCVILDKSWYIKEDSGFKYTKNITSSLYYSDSWLNMMGLEYCLQKLSRSNNEKYYFTDLLALTIDIINTVKLDELKYLMTGMLRNYSKTCELSQYFQKVK